MSFFILFLNGSYFFETFSFLIRKTCTRFFDPNRLSKRLRRSNPESTDYSGFEFLYRQGGNPPGGVYAGVSARPLKEEDQGVHYLDTYVYNKCQYAKSACLAMISGVRVAQTTPPTY